MALNTNIPMGVQPIQLADPLAQYSKVAAIQGAQQQNELARMQMAEYERARSEEDQLRNYLAQSDFTKPEARAGLTKFGKTGLAYSKALTEQDTAKLTQQETAFKVQKAKKDFVAQAQRDTSQNPSDANITAFKEDLIANPLFDNAEKQQMIAGADRILSMPVDQRKAFMASQGASASELKPQVSVGPTGIVQSPAFGGGPATVVAGTDKAFQMTPAQIKQDERDRQRLGLEGQRVALEGQRLAQDATGVVYQEDANGNVIALPSKLKKGELPTARIAVAPGGGFQPLQGKPSEAVGKEQMSINQQRAIVRGAINAVTATPDAFGMSRGLVGEAIGGRMGSSEENQARSYLFNVVSGVIKERAGTAQSAAEADTLARFLPQPTDSASVITDKMEAFDKYLLARETGTTKKRGGGTPPKPPAAGGGVDTSNPLLK